MKRSGMMLITALTFTMFTSAAYSEVKFGELYPFSGQLALLGEESARGLELAVDEINASGGIQGQQIVLERGDAVDDNQAIGEARRLISREGVKAIFGTYSSARAIAASQVAELSGIPYFELGAVADEVTNRGLKYVYRLNPTAKDMAATMIDMVVDKVGPASGKALKDLKIGLIHEDGSYGTSVAAHLTRFAKEKGLNLVSEQAYPASTVDMSSIVLTLKKHDVDVIFQCSFQNDTVLFLRQANEAGLKPLAIIGGGGGYSMQPTADAVGLDVINGVLDVDFTQYIVNKKFTPGIDDFLAAYKRKYGSDPRSGHSLVNYVGAKAVFQALDKANGFKADDILSAVKQIDLPEGSTATGSGVKIGKNNQNERARMMGMQWQNGKLVTVYPDDAAAAQMGLKQN